jgi:DNA-binding NtrC family response regulator
MLKVLIVDDQPAVRTALETLLEVHGQPALSVGTPDEALRLCAVEDVGVVLQDMNFVVEETSGAEGARLFRAIHELDPELPVVLMTAWTSLETAVQLVKEGATDYIAKPWDNDKLVTVVKNLVNLRSLKLENTRLQAHGRRVRKALAEKYDLQEVIYASPQMHDVVRLAVSIAPSDVPVLITGPNGSGKEKLADIIQANSRRAKQPFVKVNVGALPENLFEAELFGAEAGAYTGAQKLRIGRFEAATGGTLFLDELGTLPLPAQAKLLRVLQTGEYERLGSSTTRKADVRIVAATNLDLPRAIAAGQFREDLFFRLNVIELFVPPLGDRPEDILPLAEHFVAKHAAKEGKPGLKLGDDAVAALINHEWPGNVRELQNRIQRAVLLEMTDTLTAGDLGLGAGGGGGGGGEARRAEPSRRPTPRGLPGVAYADMPGTGAGTTAAAANDPERAAIEETLIRAGGVVARAAADMGMSRQALYRRMERLGIVLERRPR